MKEDVGAYLAGLRTLTQKLDAQAAQSNTIEAYLHLALEALSTQWPAFATSKVNLSTSISKASRTALPTTDGLSRWLIPIPTSYNTALAQIEFEIIDDDFKWELIQIWSQAVARAWHSSHQLENTFSAVSERLHLFESLSHIVQSIWAELVSTEILNAACRSIAETVNGVDRVAIVINDNAPVSGTVVAGYPDDTVGQVLELEGYGVYDHLLKTLEPIVINDLDIPNEILAKNQALLQRFGVKSVMILPLVVQGELIGSIGFDALTNKHNFSNAEVEVLGTIANQIAIGLQNANLFEEMQRRSISQQFVNQVVTALPLRSDLSTLLRTSGHTIGTLLDAERFNIHILPEALALFGIESTPES